MNFSSTLGRYLSRTYITNLLFMVGVLWGLVFFFDTIELLRRASKSADMTTGLIFKMALFHLPDTGLTIFPFSILFSALFTFWLLTRRHELVVVRAAGFSVWQFLAPIILVAGAAGIFVATILNPIGAAFLEKFEALENEHISYRKSFVALFDEGLWLRQVQDNGYVILHAGGVKMPDWTLQNVSVFYFTNDDSFRKRVDASSATLRDGAWYFSSAVINEPHSGARAAPGEILATDLTVEEIEKRFTSPGTLSFWRLPSFIRTMEATGFDAAPLKVRFQALLALPVLFISMVLLAAAVSLRPPRQKGTLAFVFAGVFIGFLVFFVSSFLQALGFSHQIPVFLSAWSAPVIALLLGVAALLSFEDG